MAALWFAFAFVTWNVVFDREVGVAGVEFTQQQIRRWQQGEPVATIAAAFSPRVDAAARRASLYGGAVGIAGLALLIRQRDRRP